MKSKESSEEEGLDRAMIVTIKVSSRNVLW